jgi:hypothetical protein
MAAAIEKRRLCILCDAGGGNPARELAGLLRERGNLDGLRALAEVGDQDAAEQLATLMADQGRGGEAERLRQFGFNPDGSIACGQGRYALSP